MEREGSKDCPLHNAFEAWRLHFPTGLKDITDKATIGDLIFESILGIIYSQERFLEREPARVRQEMDKMVTSTYKGQGNW